MRPEEVEALSERLNALLAELEREADPGVLEAVAELVEGIQRVHAEGLRRVAELLAEDRSRFARALDDPVVSNLFFLYDLALVDERARAEAALESVRPLARSHGGEIELVDVEEGVVSVRLHGACHGCPSSTATLRGGIERMLADKLPGFVRLEVVGGSQGREAAGRGRAAPSAPDVSPTGETSVLPEETLVRLERRLSGSRERATNGRPEADAVGPAGRAGGDPADVAALEELPPDGLVGSLVGDFPVLLVPLDGEVAAFRNACPGSPLPLHLGSREGQAVICPWHGCRYDARTGERRGGEGPPLERLPVRTEGGRVRVELP